MDQEKFQIEINKIYQAYSIAHITSITTQCRRQHFENTMARMARISQIYVHTWVHTHIYLYDLMKSTPSNPLLGSLFIHFLSLHCLCKVSRLFTLFTSSPSYVRHEFNLLHSFSSSSSSYLSLMFNDHSIPWYDMILPKNASNLSLISETQEEKHQEYLRISFISSSLDSSLSFSLSQA